MSFEFSRGGAALASIRRVTSGSLQIHGQRSGSQKLGVQRATRPVVTWKPVRADVRFPLGKRGAAKGRRCICAEAQQDDGEPFDERTTRLAAKIEEQFAEGALIEKMGCRFGNEGRDSPSLPTSQSQWGVGRLFAGSPQASRSGCWFP